MSQDSKLPLQMGLSVTLDVLLGKCPLFLLVFGVGRKPLVSKWLPYVGHRLFQGPPMDPPQGIPEYQQG